MAGELRREDCALSDNPCWHSGHRRKRGHSAGRPDFDPGILETYIRLSSALAQNASIRAFQRKTGQDGPEAAAGFAVLSLIRRQFPGITADSRLFAAGSGRDKSTLTPVPAAYMLKGGYVERMASTTGPAQLRD